MSYDLVAIVCAARGMPALRTLLAELPSTFSAPIVCLAQSHARLDRELQAATRLKVSGFERDGVAGARTVRDRGGAVLILDRATAPLYRAVHATPLFGSNEVHGVVAALFAEPHRVSAREADLMDGVAAQAAKIVAHLEGPAS